MKIGKIFLILFTVFCFVAVGANAHPYYVSICQVNYNAETNSLEVSVKTFADNLQSALENAGYSDTFLGQENEHPQTDTFISEYLQAKLEFAVNGKLQPYQFIGKEMEDGVMWLYLEITGVEHFERLGVRCSLLTEVYETQSNIIQVEKNKQIKSILLNRKKTTGTLVFSES